MAEDYMKLGTPPVPMAAMAYPGAAAAAATTTTAAQKPVYAAVCNPVLDREIFMEPKMCGRIVELIGNGLAEGGGFDLGSLPEATKDEIIRLLQPNHTELRDVPGGSVMNTTKLVAGMDSEGKYRYVVLTNFANGERADALSAGLHRYGGLTVDREGLDSDRLVFLCYVMINQATGQRTFLYENGWPVPNMSRNQLVEKLTAMEKVGSLPSILLFEGFALSSDRNAPNKIGDFAETCRILKKRFPNIRVDLSPSLSAPWQMTPEQFRDALLVGNVRRVYMDDEQFLFYCVSEKEKAEGGDIWKRIKQGTAELTINPNLIENIFITRGANSVFVMSQRGAVSEHAVPRLAGPVQSTNAAGDTFAAGLSYRMDVLGNTDLGEVVMFANILTGNSITTPMEGISKIGPVFAPGELPKIVAEVNCRMLSRPRSSSSQESNSGR